MALVLIRLVIHNNGGLVVRGGRHCFNIMTHFGSNSVAANRFTSSEGASSSPSDTLSSPDQVS